jgi:hypothetical protein
MNNLSAVVATSAVLCVASMVSSQAAAPGLYTSWIQFRFSQAECMDRASAALRAMGMTTKFEVVRSSTFGEKDDYTGTVRCAEAPKVMIFAVAGPDAQECGKLGKSLDDEFRKAKPARR